MCGRFTLKTPASSWVEQLFRGLPFLDTPDTPPRYNIAPTQPILAVLQSSSGAPFSTTWLRWGLLPSWAEDLAIGNRMINARSETLAEKPSFRKAFRERRCLIIADGYYEWKKGTGKTKQPYWIHRPGDAPFVMAGLWEVNRRISSESPIFSGTIITTPANACTQEVHDRMPAIIFPSDILRWLDPSSHDVEPLQSLLQPAPDDYFSLTPVSTRVNSPMHEGPECLIPVSPTNESPS